MPQVAEIKLSATRVSAPSSSEEFGMKAVMNLTDELILRGWSTENTTCSHGFSGIVSPRGVFTIAIRAYRNDLANTPPQQMDTIYGKFRVDLEHEGWVIQSSEVRVV